MPPPCERAPAALLPSGPGALPLSVPISLRQIDMSSSVSDSRTASRLGGQVGDHCAAFCSPYSALLRAQPLLQCTRLLESACLA